MTAPDEWPVRVLRLAAAFHWEQHAPGGCRCLCGLYHRPATGPAIPAGCTAAGEPGHFLVLETPQEAIGPMPICSSCHTELGPYATTEERDR